MIGLFQNILMNRNVLGGLFGRGAMFFFDNSDFCRNKMAKPFEIFIYTIGNIRFLGFAGEKKLELHVTVFASLKGLPVWYENHRRKYSF